VTVFTNFTPVVVICDIVAVNGKPARGAAMIRGTLVRLSPNPGPGVGISDVTRSYVMDYQWEIQDAYGSHVGTINAIGFGAGPPPLGSGEDASAGNFSVIGGTGAFLGVHGQAATYQQKVTSAPAGRTRASAKTRGIGGTTLVLIYEPRCISTP
jgi:hypothetical protein